MGLTLVEKIISEHAGKTVHAGELVISKVDVTAVQDGTGPLTVQEFKKLGKDRLNNPERNKCNMSEVLLNGMPLTLALKSIKYLKKSCSSRWNT